VSTPRKTIATIGVYGRTLDTFIEDLRSHEVRLVVDVRQRRGVRGPAYAWANSQRLQAALAAAGIEYVHRRDLAPTTELRQLQYREDARMGVGKRNRLRLAEEYRDRYQREILDSADLRNLVDMVPPGTAFALLCVESDADACHRGLIASRLETKHGVMRVDI
jgi:uncharacterized protein (DUF488 family)